MTVVPVLVFEEIFATLQQDPQQSAFPSHDQRKFVRQIL